MSILHKNIDKNKILAILGRINNGYDFLKSDYATSEKQEQELEERKRAELDRVTDQIINYIREIK